MQHESRAYTLHARYYATVAQHKHTKHPFTVALSVDSLRWPPPASDNAITSAGHDTVDGRTNREAMTVVGGDTFRHFDHHPSSLHTLLQRVQRLLREVSVDFRVTVKK